MPPYIAYFPCKVTCLFDVLVTFFSSQPLLLLSPLISSSPSSLPPPSPAVSFHPCPLSPPLPPLFLVSLLPCLPSPVSLPPPPISVIMTGAYNSFFRMLDRETGRGVTLEAWRESSKPRAVLRTRRVYTGGKRRRGDVGVDSLDFTKKILHMAWHPSENIIAIAATNNLYIFQDRVSPDAHTQ